MVKWVCLIALMFWGAETAKAQYENYDLYIVPYRGDTLRAGIQKIFLHHTRHGHVAWVKYEDGCKRRYNYKDIKAFSFIEVRGSFLWWRFSDIYRQVQVLNLNENEKTATPHFYETIASCNGHTLYLDFNSDEDQPMRLLMSVGSVLKYDFRYNRTASRDYILKFMPDCVREVDEKLWPKWAKNYYSKTAPKKPVY